MNGGTREPLPDVPTSVQLGVGKGRILLRGACQRCPVCGGGGLFRRWLTMIDRCPTCSLRFERAAGQSVGYIGINIIVCFTAMFLALMTGTLVMYPEVHSGPLLVGVLVTGVVLPAVFFPSSRTFWTAIDVLMRPLRAGEVDPRFVLVDPLRDRE